jgi:TATA-binding protein-associated factor Taf7
VKRALQPLPAKGAAVTLIQPMGFVKFFSKLMEAQGLPALEVGDAEAVPPIASVIEIEKGMTALDLVVTAETTKSLVGFAMRAAQQAGAPPAEEMEDEEATDDEDDDDDDEGEDEKDEDQAEEEVEAGTP